MTDVERIEEIAERIEQRLMARAARWMLVNIATFIGLIIAGVSAYFALEMKTNVAIEHSRFTEERVNALAGQAAVERAALEGKVVEVGHKVDEVNRFLRAVSITSRGREDR